MEEGNKKEKEGNKKEKKGRNRTIKGGKRRLRRVWRWDGKGREGAGKGEEKNESKE